MVRAVGPALPTWRTSRYTVVELPEQIDASNADVVREHLLALLNAGSGTEPLIADLTGTTFGDSSAVNALLRAHTRARAAGRRLYVAVPPGGIVRKVFDITAVSRAIPICDDVGSAIAMAAVTAIDDAPEASAGGPAASPAWAPSRTTERVSQIHGDDDADRR
jgi:anti-anti-sigma factor